MDPTLLAFQVSLHTCDIALIAPPNDRGSSASTHHRYHRSSARTAALVRALEEKLLPVALLDVVTNHDYRGYNLPCMVNYHGHIPVT